MAVERTLQFTKDDFDVVDELHGIFYLQPKRYSDGLDTITSALQFENGVLANVNWPLIEPLCPLNIEPPWEQFPAEDWLLEPYIARIDTDRYMKMLSLFWTIYFVNMLLESIAEKYKPYDSRSTLDCYRFYGSIAGMDLGAMRDTLGKAFSLKSIQIDPPVVDRETTEAIVQKAFTGEFNDSRGHLAAFLKFIWYCATKWDSMVYFAPYFPLVQSTMMGKSKTIDAVSEYAFPFALVFRLRNSSGWPPATDSDALNFLCPKWTADLPLKTVEKRDAAEDVQNRWEYFLCILFDKLRAVLEDVRREQEKSGLAGHRLLDARDKWMERRQEVFDDIKVMNTGQNWASYNKKSIPVSDSLRKLRAEFRNTHWRIATTSLADTKLELKRLILITIDEARGIANKKYGKDKISGFRLFRRALRKIPNYEPGCAVICAVMDTHSRLMNFSPLLEHDPSRRSVEDGRRLYAPYWIMPYVDQLSVGNDLDFFANFFNKQHSNGDWEAIARSLYSYGRPFWGAYFRAADDSDTRLATAVLYQNLVMMAKYKLCNDVPSNMLERQAKMAVLDSRLELFLNPTAKEAAELVANHLSVCFTISPDREQLVCGYIAEPIVSKASADIWNIKAEDDDAGSLYISTLIKELRLYVLTDLVRKGDRGELVAKILVLLAYDHCSNSEFNKFNGHAENKNSQCPLWLKYAVPVSVRSFLKSFIGYENVSKEGKAVEPDGSQWKQSNKTDGSKEAKDTTWPAIPDNFLDGHVFCLQFLRYPKSPTVDQLQGFFRRGVGIMCKENQAGIDFIIPVRLTGGKMSAILIQTRNKRSDIELDRDPANMSAVRCELMEHRNVDRPYLCVYQQLDENAIKIPEGIYPLAVNNRQTGSSANNQKSDSVNQFAILANKLSETTYPFLQGTRLPGVLDELKLLLQQEPFEYYNESHDVIAGLKYTGVEHIVGPEPANGFIGDFCEVHFEATKGVSDA